MASEAEAMIEMAVSGIQAAMGPQHVVNNATTAGLFVSMAEGLDRLIKGRDAQLDVALLRKLYRAHENAVNLADFMLQKLAEQTFKPEGT